MRWRRQAWPSLNKVPIVRAAMRLQAHGVEDQRQQVRMVV